jgi:hypothetical protein
VLFRARQPGQSKNWTEGLACVKAPARPSGQTFRIEEKDLYTMVIEEDGIELEVTIVCGCELPVNKITEDSFYCQHCDRVCDYADCVLCKGLDEMFELRFPKED